MERGKEGVRKGWRGGWSHHGDGGRDGGKWRIEGKEETHIHCNNKRIIQGLMVSTLFSQ